MTFENNFITHSKEYIFSDNDILLKQREEIFDKIRMLDSDDYPRAFVKVGKLKIVFSKAVKRQKSLQCNVKITKI